MKIAFVSQTVDGVVPPIQNSIGIWTYQVARRLAHAHDVTVYAKWSRSLPTPKWHENVRYRFVLASPSKLLDRSKMLARYSSPKRPPFAAFWYSLEYSLQVAFQIRRQQYDIVHIHNFSQFVPVIRALNPAVKIVLHMQAEWLTQLDYALIEKRISKTDLVISCSEYLTNKIRHRFPHFAARCQTVFNGVDTNHFITNNDYKKIREENIKKLLFIGRVSPEKGVHVLLDAFRHVVKQYPHVQLSIVGPIGELPLELIVGISEEKKVADLASFYNGTSYQAHLQERITAEMADRVTFTGLIPHAEVNNYYRTADILINPSFSESFGMSLIEAMISEVPVVATRVGGMTEIVKEGETGYLVESGDVDGLADAIVRILADDRLQTSMGKAGRQRAIDRYSWDSIAARVSDHYHAIQ